MILWKASWCLDLVMAIHYRRSASCDTKLYQLPDSYTLSNSGWYDFIRSSSCQWSYFTMAIAQKLYAGHMGIMQHQLSPDQHVPAFHLDYSRSHLSTSYAPVIASAKGLELKIEALSSRFANWQHTSPTILLHRGMCTNREILHARSESF